MGDKVGDKMSDYIIKDGELMHHGVPGMKWGKRIARGHAGPRRYLTKKRQLTGDKKDLEYINKGGHLSVGLTKKRQAAYDARDKARLEKRIAKTSSKLEKKAAKYELEKESFNKLGKTGKARVGKVLAAGAVAGLAVAAVGGLASTKTGRNTVKNLWNSQHKTTVVNPDGSVAAKFRKSFVS